MSITKNTLTKCEVLGVDDNPLSIHVGDEIEVVFVKRKTEENSVSSFHRNRGCLGCVTTITKDSDGLIEVKIGKSNGSENSVVTSNEKDGWFRFRIVQKKEKSK